MPQSNNIYWYGYANGFQDCTTANGWGGIRPLVAPTHNTNSITLNGVTNTSICAYGCPTSMSSGKIVNFIGNASASNMSEVEVINAKSNLGSGNIQTLVSIGTSKLYSRATLTTTGYVTAIAFANGTTTIDSIWLE